MEFLPTNTAFRIHHHMDADKTYWEKARNVLLRNVSSYTEQIPEKTLKTQEFYGHLPPISKTFK